MTIGECKCKDGFIGKDCLYKQCKDNCNGNRATANGKLAANAVGMLFGVINAMSYLGITPKLSYRESQMLKDIINGMTYDELSIKYGLSATRIRQIVEKTCNKLTSMPLYFAFQLYSVAFEISCFEVL